MQVPDYKEPIKTTPPVPSFDIGALDKTYKRSRDDLEKSDKLETIVDSSIHPSPLKKSRTLEATPVLSQEKLNNKIDVSLKQQLLDHEAMKRLKNEMAQNSTVQIAITLTQQAVSDFVLKGGSASLRAGLSFLLQPSEVLTQVNQVVPIIKSSADLIDTAIGNIGMIYQYNNIEAAREELTKIETNHELSPEQKSRVEEVKKIIDFESEMLSERGIGQTLRSMQNILYTGREVSLMTATPLATTLGVGAGAGFFAAGTALYGYLFYQASKNLDIHQNWSNDFTSWLEKSSKNLVENTKEDTIGNFLKGRHERDNKNLEDLKGKITRKEISMETIKERIEKFKIGPSQTKEAVQKWMKEQTNDSLLLLYIDYHSVMDKTVKGALTEMVSKKHKIEDNLLQINKTLTGVQLAIGAILFGVALALLIVAVTSNPIGASFLILIFLSGVSGITAGTVVGATYYQSYQYKPTLTAEILKGAYLKLLYYYAEAGLNSVKENIEEYFANEKDRLRSVSQTILSTKDADTKVKRRSEEWRRKAAEYEEELNKMAWADFAKAAGLQVASQDNHFDTLNAFNDALSNCDLSLLSDETILLLEKQLGINIFSLQLELQKDPSAVKNLIRNFFNLKEEDYIRFIRQQDFLHNYKPVT